MRADQLSLTVDALDPGDSATTVADESLTVRAGAKAFVSDGSRVLLVKEHRDDGSSFWSLPGGGVEPGESLRAAVRRELAEEIQCHSTVGDLVTRCLYRHTSLPNTITLYSVFTARPVTKPEVNCEEGVLACRWCDPADPPPGLLDPFRQVVQTLAERP